MARRPLFPLIDRILEGRLRELLAKWRANGLSYEEIAVTLRLEHEVTVSSKTVREWCVSRLPLDAAEEAAG